MRNTVRVKFGTFRFDLGLSWALFLCFGLLWTSRESAEWKHNKLNIQYHVCYVSNRVCEYRSHLLMYWKIPMMLIQHSVKILIGCSTLSQEYRNLIGWHWIMIRRQLWTLTCLITHKNSLKCHKSLYEYKQDYTDFNVFSKRFLRMSCLSQRKSNS